jgi:hypothetical protein
MPAPDLYTHLLHRLNETGIPYMITGGVAAIMYGEPRLTNDADIIDDRILRDWLVRVKLEPEWARAEKFAE